MANRHRFAARKRSFKPNKLQFPPQKILKPAEVFYYVQVFEEAWPLEFSFCLTVSNGCQEWLS